MQIYDIVAMGENNLRQHVRKHFYANAHLKDERVIEMVLTKAYIDLEETLLQYKQKVHLLMLLESPVPTHHNLKRLNTESSVDERFARLS
jgi:NADH dehydrogenase (ubiquinone) 1 alpha subcomplex subunit 6